MDEDQRHRRRCSGQDRISDLPDELLHGILVRLGSADAAARTSVLSRRWRHLWAHLPELRLVAPPARAAVPPAWFISSVDAALGGYQAPTLEHLSVSHRTEQQDRDLGILARRIASWLRFAAERVVGELNLYLCVPQVFVQPVFIGEESVLNFPVFERAKRIEVFLQYAETTWLRPQASGLFPALTFLKIDRYVCMEGTDLTALVSTQCPCLTDLHLLIKLIVNFDLSIHSNSLGTTVLHVLQTRRLEILAPRLEELTTSIKPLEAHISAPKLVNVSWHGTYDPHIHRFVDVGRTLRLLKTLYGSLSLTKRFDEVDELELSIDLKYPVLPSRYRRFMSETNKLPKCKRFCVLFSWEHHALAPAMLHLLRSCDGHGTKKFQVHLCGPSPRRVKLSCLPSCPCRLEESRKIDGIDLSSLEEVEITGFKGSHEEMKLVEVLLSIAGILKTLVINDWPCPMPKPAREKVRSMCHPNVRVEFIGLPD